MTLKTGGSSVAGRMWTTTPQTWVPKAGRSTYMRQQPGRHDWRQLTAWQVAYQTATCHCRQNEEMLVSDAIEWPEVLWRESVQDFVRQDVRRSWTKHAVGHIASADWLMRQWCGQPNSALPTPNADPDSLSLSDPSFTPRHLKVWTAVKTLWSNTHVCIHSVWTCT